MELIDRILFRKINPSDFKKMYNIGKPKTGGGQTYIELAGIPSEDIEDFLSIVQLSEKHNDPRFTYTMQVFRLGAPTKTESEEVIIEPRTSRLNYKINTQTLNRKHSAWDASNGFPEPTKNANGEYEEVNSFQGIIDDLVIYILRTTHNKYYAGFINEATIPSSWPQNIGLERMFQGERRGVIKYITKKIEFIDDKDNPFGQLVGMNSLMELYESNKDWPFERNRIVFGAPGTGKSFRLNEDLKELLKNGGEYERVTFHSDYSYASFVGTYKPVPDVDKDGLEIISYKYIPGPFMNILIKAIKSCSDKSKETEPYLLIVEEINRADPASVFGDVFQLLDRGGNISEYPINASSDMKKFLYEVLGEDVSDYSQLRIPENMFIWATMNSADQGVYPMDTAFKRRWNFEYIGINDSEKEIENFVVDINPSKESKQEYKWNSIRKAINEELLEYDLNEDKLLGPFFLKVNVFEDPSNKGKLLTEDFNNAFKNKVLMYLYEDAAKQHGPKLFRNNDANRNRKLTYSEICANYDDYGIKVFNNSVVEKIKDLD